jgi:hypothetical protein
MVPAGAYADLLQFLVPNLIGIAELGMEPGVGFPGDFRIAREPRQFGSHYVGLARLRSGFALFSAAHSGFLRDDLRSGPPAGRGRGRNAISIQRRFPRPLQ